MEYEKREAKLRHEEHLKKRYLESVENTELAGAIR